MVGGVGGRSWPILDTVWRCLRRSVEEITSAGSVVGHTMQPFPLPSAPHPL